MFSHSGSLFTLANTYLRPHKIVVVFVLLRDSSAYEFYVPTFRNTVCSIFIGGVITLTMKIEQSVPKRRNIKFSRRGTTQKKEYKIQNTAKV